MNRFESFFENKSNLPSILVSRGFQGEKSSSDENL